MMNQGFRVTTFGCKVNTYDSGLLQKRLLQAGFKMDADGGNLHILNSCAVTAEATKEAMRQARRIKAKDPFATVVLTGCAAQVDGDLVDESAGIDLIVANSHKYELENILKSFYRGDLTQKVFRSNIFRRENLGAGGGEELGHTRSYLKIQDGCNSFCSFCVIPFARGKSRSLPVPLLLEKIKELQGKGVQEVVLTGVHIGDYLDEETFGGPFQLDDLVEQVLLKTEIPRVRLTSLEPIELTEKLLGLFAHKRMCSHFHMSLQSLSSPILKAMRRQYSAEQVGEALCTINQRFPDAFVGLDVITGFPGETEELFQETYENLKKWPWTRIHVFPYSERQGTRATEMGGVVPVHVRKERAKLLRQLSHERFDIRALDQLGRNKDVLFLKKQDNYNIGLSSDYWDVAWQSGQEYQKGQRVSLKIRDYQRLTQNRMNGFLVGEYQ